MKIDMTNNENTKVIPFDKKKTTEKKRKKKKKKGAGFFPTLLLIIFIGSLAACGYLIYKEINKEIGIKDMETDIQTFVRPQTQKAPANDNIPDNVSTETDEQQNDTNEPDFVFNWEGIKAESPYVIGWLQIPGIERINYPIVQHADDNQYFLTHDWKGNAQSAGSIFMNVNNTSDFTDMNSILYGHRMKSGSMFGLLKTYADQKFMDENPYFYIYTPDGAKLTYEVICFSGVKDGSDAYLMYFQSPKERMAYYDMMQKAYDKETKTGVLAKRDVELDRFDTTIMLSTCGNTREDYYARQVLLAKLIYVDLKGQTEDWTGTIE